MICDMVSPQVERLPMMMNFVPEIGNLKHLKHFMVGHNLIAIESGCD